MAIIHLSVLAQKETNRKNVSLFPMKKDEAKQNDKAAAAIGVCASYFLKKILLLCFDRNNDFEIEP